MLFLFKLADFIFQFFISTVEKLILMLHDAPNAAVQKALTSIAKLAAVKAPPVMIRVESFE